MVSNELLIELKTIIREDYSVELPTQRVSEIGSSLVGFFELLMEIYSKDHEGGG